MAIVNAKSSAATGTSASATEERCGSRGGASNGRRDWAELWPGLRCRARYAAMRSASSPRHAAASSAGRLPEDTPTVPAVPDMGSSDQEPSLENEESQKVQARTLDASTAPHCEQVFVTGVFALRTLPLR